MAINVTENAAKHIRRAVSQKGGIGLRLGVKKVGCSGLAYSFGYASDVGSDDQLFE